MTRVTSSQTMTRIRSTVSSSSVRNLMSLCHLHQADRSLLISAKEPFLPLHVIEQLTLSDITDLFRYTVEVRKPKFDRAAFVSALPSSSTLVLRGVLDAMDQVTTESSGGACLVTVRESSDDDSRCSRGETSNEDIDALFFCAATRIFAEWRSLRLVPPNCNPRYGIGMNLARRDLVQNIHKVESATHSWLVHHLQRTAPMSCRPTIRQILEFELQQPNFHARLPRLTDKSGASGVLWIKRQLSYQTRLFDNISKIPYHFADNKSAVTAAYQATYHAYHGFFVKQIFQSSFEAAPDAQTILQYMNIPASLSSDTETTIAEDHEWSDIEEDDGDAGIALQGDDDAWVQLPVDETVDATPSARRGASIGNQREAATYMPAAETSNPFETIGGLLEEHMNKLQKFVGQCVGAQVDSNPHRNVMEAQVGPSLMLEQQACASNEAMHTVSNVIPTYLVVLQPLLDALDQMLHELNMNDPTKI
jgi:Glycolipid transfer protein (GLTP)